MEALDEIVGCNFQCEVSDGRRAVEVQLAEAIQEEEPIVTKLRTASGTSMGHVLRCGTLRASLVMASTAAAAHHRRRRPLSSLACAAAVFGLDEESEFVTLDTYKSFLDETGRFTDWDAFRKLVFFRGLDNDVRPTLQLVQGRCRVCIVIERPLWLVHVCG